MTKHIKHLLVYTFLMIITIGSILSFPTAGKAAVEDNAAIAVDAQTGQVLYNQNADKRLAVASMSKMLTVAVIEHEIDAGRLKWSSKVKITPAEAKLSKASGYSNVPLQAGKSYTVKDLTKAALIKSGDAATIALSRAEGKNTQQFVQQMGAEAQRIGLSNYRLYNGVGLENKDMASFKLPKTAGAAENEMTARDVAKVAKYLVNNYPAILQITGQRTLKWDGKSYQNGNELLAGNPQAPQKIKVDGLKTGTSDKAGQCLASTGTYRGHRIITVVMHAQDRFTQTKDVYREVFTKWTPTDSQQGIKVKVEHGQKQNATIQTKKAVTVWQPKGQAVAPQLVVNKHYRGQQGLKAPLKKNNSVGKISFHGLTNINGQSLQFGGYPAEEVNRTGILGCLATFF